MAGLSEHLEEYFNAGIHVGLCFVSQFNGVCVFLSDSDLVVKLQSYNYINNECIVVYRLGIKLCIQLNSTEAKLRSAVESPFN